MSEQITLVNPRNARYQCSGCDYLCNLLTALDAPHPNTCVVFRTPSTKSKWRSI